MPPAFIYFDLGNVVLHFDHRRSARQMAEVAGVDESRVWEVVFEGDLHSVFERGHIGARDFYEAFCRETDSRPDFAALTEAGSAIFDLNATIVPLIAHLEDAGWRLGILSNTNESHWAYCVRRFKIIPEAFDVTILSYEVHSMKPEPEIYQTAAQRAGVAADQIFFVDDREENVEGARQAGLDAVRYVNVADLARQLRARGVDSNF